MREQQRPVGVFDVEKLDVHQIGRHHATVEQHCEKHKEHQRTPSDQISARDGIGKQHRSGKPQNRTRKSDEDGVEERRGNHTALFE